MLWFHKGSVIRDMDALMKEGVNPHLDNIVSHRELPLRFRHPVINSLDY